MPRTRRSGSRLQLLRKGHKRRFGKDGKVTWEELSDLFSDFDMARIIARISEELLKEHVVAVKEGEKADGSGDQPPLKPRSQQAKRAKRGERPPHRGHTGHRSGFPTRLRRKKVNSSRVVEGVPTKATTVIDVGSRVLQGFLAQEKRRGVRYLYGNEGKLAKLIERILEEETEAALEGTGKDYDKAKKTGRDVSR